MNSKAIADAIAGRFTGVTATVNGVAESLTHCTASLPNSIAKGPALLVYPPTGELEIVARRRADTLLFTARLLRDPISVPTRVDALYAWYDALRDRVEMDMDLGLGSYVAWAHTEGSMRIELDGESYSKSDGSFGTFDVIDLPVLVRLDEVVTTLAV